MSLSIDRLVDARRKNLRRLADQHGATRLSEMLGHKSVSFFSQMVGPKARRVVTERTARTIEQRLGLEPGWLDLDFDIHEPEA